MMTTHVNHVHSHLLSSPIALDRFPRLFLARFDLAIQTVCRIFQRRFLVQKPLLLLCPLFLQLVEVMVDGLEVGFQSFACPGRRGWRFVRELIFGYFHRTAIEVGKYVRWLNALPGLTFHPPASRT